MPITKTPTLETLSTKTGHKTKIANLPELQSLSLTGNKLVIGGAITIQVSEKINMELREDVG